MISKFASHSRAADVAAKGAGAGGAGARHGARRLQLAVGLDGLQRAQRNVGAREADAQQVVVAAGAVHAVREGAAEVEVRDDEDVVAARRGDGRRLRAEREAVGEQQRGRLRERDAEAARAGERGGADAPRLECDGLVRRCDGARDEARVARREGVAFCGRYVFARRGRGM